ncbi:TIGR04222 domain-containing membrane protein [Streptomyces sp. NA02950]|uniref:TIGR04222 domain-containing membrane protein n=1 Tax=Streptomyces sp. NA02950 TaxID=2742137 RepID=UPI001592A8CE|nr:TIGR04222 domain-containing membrane protein [Streptomyces sp. NA02950]QKV95104.1 TIGR04222 domain-containing membrane protein [Streptomyces sp. NA02950]
MRAEFRRSSARGATPPTLGLYDIACLAGGPQRVVETALIALSERGVVVVRRARVRAVGGTDGDRPVEPIEPIERALLGLCPRIVRADVVFGELMGGRAVAEIERRLVSYGLLTSHRRRPTRVGRRHLEAVREGGEFPAYVFDGPAAVPDRVLRRAVWEAAPEPSDPGWRVMWTGVALAPDDDTDSGGHPGCGSDGGHGCGGGGHGCGGGGGGGGD